MSEIPQKGQQELKKVLSSLEHAPPHYSTVLDINKIEWRVQYELTRYPSGQLNSFFEDIAVIYPHLSLNQMEKLRISFGSFKENFFKGTEMYEFLKANTSPLFVSQHRKAEKYRNATQINLYSDEFHRKFFSRTKVYNCQYDSEHLKLAIAILNVSIFILEVLLPRSVDDEERYKQSLRTIGITDEKSVEKLAYERYRYMDEFRNLSLKIKTFFRNGMLDKLSDPPKPKAFHQEVFNTLAANESFRRFLWETCDTCQKRVNHLGIWRTEVRCTECKGECPILPEPTSPAQASDSLQSLATEITTAKISFGESAQEIAQKLLENGVSQLSELSVLNQSEFESLVQELRLNTLQLQKLRVASGRQ